jgi:LPS sulfotransferase NodH
MFTSVLSVNRTAWEIEKMQGKVAADEISFMIIGDARTGTTMLRHMLNQHPEVKCAGELISNDVETVFRRRWMRLSIPFRARLIACPAFKKLRIRWFLWRNRSQRVVGFKALYDQIPSALEPTLLDKIDRFILILRRDRVRRALSLMKARRDGAWNLVKGTQREPPKSTPITVQFDELSADILRSEQEDAYWTEWIRKRGRKASIVVYEELVGDRISVLGAILHSLELERGDAAGLEPATIRMSEPAPLKELIANYDELMAASTGSRMASILEAAERPLS